MQTVVNTIAGNDVHAEAVMLVNSAGQPLHIEDDTNLVVHATIYGNGSLSPIKVDADGKLDITSSVGVLVDLGSGTEGPAKTEDAPSADNDSGIPAMAIRKATPANTSDTDGDYEMLQMDGGRLHVRDLDLGSQADSAASSDTGTFSLIALFKWLLGKLPASLGGKTAAASFSVTTATDDPELTLIGSATEAAPATDTASSGLNGRLQRIAQRITTLLGIYDSTNVLLPTAGKKLAVATYSPTLFQNLGADVTKNVKASAGNVFSIICYNANAAARYLQLHNTATTPASSAVPILSFLVPPSGQIGIGSDIFTNEGINFATGIAFAFSTARNIYTAGSAGDQSTFIQYK